MAGDIPDIDPGDGGGVDETIRPKKGAKARPSGGETCLSCGATLVGEFCSACGQRNDDMRRSSLILFRDFIEDTFSFDSRMWRTLGLMASKPGLVASSYSHGRRSRYTPPVRLFLVVSFLFFLTLSFTKTYFIAMEVRANTAEEINEAREYAAEALKDVEPDVKKKIAAAEVTAGDAIDVAGQDINCNISVKLRFFIRAKDLDVDEEKWRECADSITTAANTAIDDKEGDEKAADLTDDNPLSEEDLKEGLDRVVGGVGRMVSDPAAFNREVNEWLPRVMFFMAPILALILALFIRGRDALFFDHLVLSLYSHATGFAVFGLGIIAGQLGFSAAFPMAVLAMCLYYLFALKRAYKRGWVKTVYTAIFSGLLYMLVLTSAVSAIISNKIWQGG